MVKFKQHQSIPHLRKVDLYRRMGRIIVIYMQVQPLAVLACGALKPNMNDVAQCLHLYLITTVLDEPLVPLEPVTCS